MNLPARIHDALTRPNPDLRTVRDLLALVRAGALGEVRGIGPLRATTVKQILLKAGLPSPGEPGTVTPASFGSDWCSSPATAHLRGTWLTLGPGPSRPGRAR
ncbi:hypothetical protein [Actinomadura sp. SCN-SB]|uniref:hypothetical protein n=1 Tax=Actinomadura sp. SCN-SB TaxID=3373092 RepID=UPI003751935B